MPRFQVQTIAHNDDAVEGQPRFGAIPNNELIDRVLVNSARSWRPKAIENCCFTMIQIRQAKHSATVIRLDSLFTHDDGLPNAAPLGRGRQHGRCNQPWDRTGFERYRLITEVWEIFRLESRF